MTKTLSRAQLYELVWSQPRTALAKELGVSDVWIGKQCARACIPAPPQGYWARSRIGRLPKRPPLPIRLPGQSDELTLGSADAYRHGPRIEDLNEPLLPPVFTEDIEQQVTEALRVIGRITPCRDLSDPHEGLKRVLAAEARRRLKYEGERQWSFYKPYFDDPQHQRQLRLFNSIGRALGRTYGRQEVYCHDEWIQGIGTQHFLKLRLDFGDAGAELEFLEPGEVRGARRAKGVAITTLRVGNEHSHLGMHDWVDEPGNRLEGQLEDIIRSLLFRAENTTRYRAQAEYERRVERRKEILEGIEAAKREAERRRLQAIEARRQQVRKGILEMAQQRQMATEIRAMVAALAGHPDLASGDQLSFDAWSAEALKVTDTLDPMKQPLGQLLRDFGEQ